MVDTVRTDGEILELLADNTTGNISAQDMRDMFVTLRDRDVVASPDAFSITDITGATLGQIAVADPIALAGLNVPAIARATGSLTFRVNGGSFVTDAVVQVGDEIEARMVASPENETEVTGTLTIGATADTWSITTGNFWTPFLDEEMTVKAFMQEDLEAGAATSWLARGVKPVTATGNATKLVDNSGVLFTGTQNIQWPTDNDAPNLHRWWVGIAQVGSGSGLIPILKVHDGQGGAVYRQPFLFFDLGAGSVVSNINDGSHKLLSETIVEGWNIVVGMHRGWQHRAWLNGEEQTPQEFLSMQPPNHELPSWIGAGTTTAGNEALAADLTIDCVIIGQGEPSDAFIDKLVGWAHWRAGRADLLDAGHPYKDAPPAPDGSEGVPARYAHDATEWAAYNATPADFDNFGEAPPTPDETYSRVFFDDFVDDTVESGVTGQATAPFYVQTDNGNVGKDAIIGTLTNDPSSYSHTSGGSPAEHYYTLSMLHNGSAWQGSAMYTVNESGKGRWWGKGRFITRIRFRDIPAFDAAEDFPWPGFFPAWWSYDKDHRYWRTRNRLEHDYFEHEGASVEDDRIAQTLHVHAGTLAYDHEDVLAADDSGGLVGHSNLKISEGWPADVHFYDGEWHTYEMRIEEDFTYIIVDGVEVGRRATPDMLAVPKFFIWDFALRLAQGEDPTGLGPWHMDIDYFEVHQLEADLAAVPTGFSGRPTLAGTRGDGNTITVTPNTTASQIEYRWYKDGEPIVGEESATFEEDADSATKALRVHVRAVSLLDQPEAWTAELEAA